MFNLHFYSSRGVKFLTEVPDVFIIINELLYCSNVHFDVKYRGLWRSIGGTTLGRDQKAVLIAVANIEGNCLFAEYGIYSTSDIS